MIREAKTLKIANEYGNFDVGHNGVPKGYALVIGQRLTALCRNHGIAYVPAVTDWVDSGYKKYGSRPVFGGVIVTIKMEVVLRRLITEREAKAADPTAVKRRAKAKAARKAKRRQEEANHRQQEANHLANCDRLGIHDPDGRLGQSVRCGLVGEDFAELLAFKARYRHEFTDYDMQFDDGEFRLRREMGCSPDEAAMEMREEARRNRIDKPIPVTWSDYLDMYGFESEVAKALAAVLKDPQRCHPTWFKEAEIAVRRIRVPLNPLTYETIRNAVESWRNSRSE